MNIYDIYLRCQQAIKIGLDISTAMAFLHEEAIANHIVIHRDLKPDNVSFTTTDQLKVRRA